MSTREVVFYNNQWCTEWRDEHGDLHREGDLPAVIWQNGSMEWWVRGSRSRDFGRPAVIHKNGRQEWWYHGMHVTVLQAMRLYNVTVRQSAPTLPKTGCWRKL